jgi:hypothetical protein
LAVTLEVSAVEFMEAESEELDFESVEELHLVSAIRHIKPRKAKAIFFILYVLFLKNGNLTFY